MITALADLSPEERQQLVSAIGRNARRDAIRSFINAVLLARAIAPHDEAINTIPFLPNTSLAKLIELRVKRLYEAEWLADRA